jgi:hypothetical protein
MCAPVFTCFVELAGLAALSSACSGKSARALGAIGRVARGSSCPDDLGKSNNVQQHKTKAGKDGRQPLDRTVGSEDEAEDGDGAQKAHVLGEKVHTTTVEATSPLTSDRFSMGCSLAPTA